MGQKERNVKSGGEKLDSLLINEPQVVAALLSLATAQGGNLNMNKEPSGCGCDKVSGMCRDHAHAVVLEHFHRLRKKTYGRGLYLTRHGWHVPIVINHSSIIQYDISMFSARAREYISKDSKVQTCLYHSISQWC